MKKLLISGGIALLTVPSLCYYIGKYYINKTLSFNESNIILFTIICSLIIFGLMFSIYNAFQNFKLHNELIEIKAIVKEYHDKEIELANRNHYENLEYHNNNREIILDLEKE